MSFFTEILRNEFALEYLLVDVFLVLFSGAICMIFFDHCFAYLISSYVMVMFFPQVFKA